VRGFVFTANELGSSFTVGGSGGSVTLTGNVSVGGTMTISGSHVCAVSLALNPSYGLRAQATVASTKACNTSSFSAINSIASSVRDRSRSSMI
jgi:hypothetical protein